MTEAEFFEQILGIKEIRIDRVDWQEQSLHIYCSSIFEEALCPHCLNKRHVVHQTYERQFLDLPITGKEVYLHLSQRQFYCPDCDRHFNERFGCGLTIRLIKRPPGNRIDQSCPNIAASGIRSGP